MMKNKKSVFSKTLQGGWYLWVSILLDLVQAFMKCLGWIAMGFIIWWIQYGIPLVGQVLKSGSINNHTMTMLEVYIWIAIGLCVVVNVGEILLNRYYKKKKDKSC